MQPKPILPPRLHPGAHVALVSPSGPLREPAGLVRAEANCRSLGLEPEVMPHSNNRWGYLAGTDKERLDDLNRALTDPAIDGVWCLRGGSGLNRIIDGVNFDAFARRPKVVLGYSDITVLLLALWTRTGVVSFHGPVAHLTLAPGAAAHLQRVLLQSGPPGTFDNHVEGAIGDHQDVRTIVRGRAQGRLLGGNLSLLQAVVGTPYFPDLDGAILFIEDVNEAIYRIDRMLAQLRTIGALRRLAGVIIGRVTDIPEGVGDLEISLDSIWQEYFGNLGIPVAAGFPVGHIDSQWTMPMGVMAELDADAGTVTILESAVS